MSGVRKKSWEGDLFPRGPAPTSTPRIKKRDGQVLFTPSSKRQRTRPTPTDNADQSVTRYGAMFSSSRVVVGMTLLAVVTRVDKFAVRFALPGGLHASADPEEVLVEDEKIRQGRGGLFKGREGSDSESDNEDETSDDESDIGNERVRVLWEFLKKGDVVRVVVVSAGCSEKYRTIKVSLKTELINATLNPMHLLRKGFGVSGAIRSVEDHGFVVSFGAHIAHTGFLEEGEGRVGELVEIVTLKETRQSKRCVVKVGNQTSAVLKAKAEGELGYTDLRAGMLLKGIVAKSGDAGVALKVCGVLSVAVDAAHVPEGGVQIGKSVMVRLLYVDGVGKRAVGTLLDSWIQRQQPRAVPEGWKVGMLMKKLKVEVIKPGFGLALSLFDEDDSDGHSNGEDDDEDVVKEAEIESGEKIPVLAHISCVSDSKNAKLQDTFHQGMVVTNGARIISVSLVDGVLNVDMRPSILKRKALSLEEVEEGSLYDCRIMNHTFNGSICMAVDGDPRLFGVIPASYISDVSNSAKRLAANPKFSVGAVLKCRALFVNIKKGKVILTSKTSIVSLKHQLLTSFEQAEQAIKEKEGKPSGSVFTGIVSKTLSSCAVVVRFCGQLAGIVPASELCIDFNDNTSEMRTKVENVYPVGQTVYVRATKVDSKLRRLWLSMDVRLKSEEESYQNFELGTLVDGLVRKVDNDAKHLVLTVSSGQLCTTKENSKGEIMEVESEMPCIGNGNETIECYLPFGHLSDIPGIADKLVGEINSLLDERTGVEKECSLRLESLLLLSVRDGIPTLSLKQSLKAALLTNQLPRSFDEICAVGQDSSDKHPVLLRGYVKALLPTGVIVGFLGNAVGFVRIARIGDHFISDPARALKIDQSVSAIIQSLDIETKRFSLSLRLSDVGNDGLAANTLSLFGSFDYWQKALRKSNFEKEFPIGSLITVPAGKEHTYGFTYDLKCSSGSATGVALKVSETSLENAHDYISNAAEGTFGSSGKTKLKRKYAIEETVQGETVRVLDVDPFSGIVDLSRDQEVVEGGRKKSVLNKEGTFRAKVLLVKNGYLILALFLSKLRSAVVFALGPAVSDNLAIRPGTILQCTVLDKRQALTQRNLVLIDWRSFRNDTLQRAPRMVTQKKESEVSETITQLLSSGSSELSAIVGKKIAGKVTERFLMHDFLSIAPGIVGHLHITNASNLNDDELSKISVGPVSEDISSRLTLPEKGSKLKSVFIAGIRRAAEEVESGPMIVEVSMTEKGADTRRLAIGQKVLGFIKNLSERLKLVKPAQNAKRSYTRTKITLSPSIVAACRDEDCLVAEDDITWKVGMPVMCRIISIEGGDVWVTMTQNGCVEGGDFFKGVVANVIPGTGIRVKIPWNARPPDCKNKFWGIVGLCDVDSDFDKVSDVLSSLQAGDVVSVRKVDGHLDNSDKNREIWLSMRSNDSPPRDSLLTMNNIGDLKQGAKIRGIVKAVSKKGCFVIIGRNITAQVKLCDLADDFVKNPEVSYPVGTVVEGKIGKVDQSRERVKISLVLRKRPRKTLKEISTVNNFKEGEKVEGTVKQIASYGVLVELSKGVNVLLHKSEADQDRLIKNPADEWTVGQRISAIVISVDKKGIKIGTKKCYFEAAGFDDEQTESFLVMNETSKKSIDKGRLGEGMSGTLNENVNNQTGSVNYGGDGDVNMGDKDIASSEDVLSSDDSVPMKVDDIEVEDKESVEPPKPFSTDISADEDDVTLLDIGQEFNFDDLGQSDDGSKKVTEEEQSNVERKEDHKKKTSHDRRERKRQKEAEEKAIRLREEALANNPDSPETVDDFERLLVGEPNSSVLWIRYMAFCLSLSQVDKARSVAERAIETISPESDTDRTNIWIAYINLEARYGASNTVEDTVADNLGFKRYAAVFRVFDRGCERVTDVKNFHLQAATALRSVNPELADEVLRRTVRRFKRSKKVWIANGLAQFKAGNKAGAQRTLEKALISLEKKKHVDVIAKFAQFEYKFGSPEKGRTVFESLVGNLPRRLDFWNIYLDMETGQCRHATDENRDVTVQRTSSLFERATTLQFSTKKMKFLFQKWLSFEKLFGNSERRVEVKNRARAFVERNALQK